MSSTPSPTPAARAHRVAVVDDHTLMREGMKMLLENLQGLSCAWTAGDTSEALRLLEADMPDALVVDITMPGRNGLELIKDIRALYPDLAVLVVSMHDEALYAQRALKAGAKGYVMKDAPHGVFEKAIRHVLAGGIALSEKMSESILLAFSSGTNPGPEGAIHNLSDREFEVFQLIGEARSTAQIAAELGISPKTVDVHKLKIRQKLSLTESTSLTAFAIRWVELRKLDIKEPA
ncbi:MAG TPA: response regulator transcription factor, partial [Prosthecobacter sp.]|nr:response regulator transcription factor [Prosthecobacter sp.]